MRKTITVGKITFALMPVLLSVSGCAVTRPGAEPPGNLTSKQPVTTHGASSIPHYIRATKSNYDANTNEVRLEVQSIPDSDLHNNNNEGIFDSDNPEGIINFATAHFPDKDINRVRVNLTTTNTELINLPVRAALTDPAQTLNIGFHVPPQGVSIDPNIRPLASLNASIQAKVAALRTVAESKLGTPYVWGHNEDRGQNGFDCSNYTAYVYHHALGYSFTSVSRLQYSSVGVRAPISDMRPGDLLAFNQGGHVGIYMGNGQMIQMGGGTAKCSYLPVTPGSYWYSKLSAVKHMF